MPKGTKDALCYKFKRLMIGQNYSAMCTNEGGHRDAFLNQWCKAAATYFVRPAEQATESQVKREASLFSHPCQ